MIVKMKCPICGNEEFYFVPSPSMGSNQSAYTIILTGAFSGATADRYVCTRCGYLVEMFNQNELQKIAKKYGK